MRKTFFEKENNKINYSKEIINFIEYLLDENLVEKFEYQYKISSFYDSNYKELNEIMKKILNINKDIILKYGINYFDKNFLIDDLENNKQKWMNSYKIRKNNFIDFIQLIINLMPEENEIQYNINQPFNIHQSYYQSLVEINANIKSYLKKLNCRIIKKNDKIIIDYKDPISEGISENQSEEITNMIYEYLSIKSGQKSKKAKTLAPITNIIEELLDSKKIDELIAFKKELFKGTKEYIQLIRHNKKEDQNCNFFYKNEENNYDKLFSICITILGINKSYETIKSWNNSNPKHIKK